MQRFGGWLVVALLGIGLAGCASSQSGSVYTRGEARQEMRVAYGVVEEIRPVLIEGTSGTVGTLAGAAVGGIAGSTIGGGRGAAIATVIGAVAGGVAGAAVEEGVTRQDGWEITVRFDDGALRAYVQAADPNAAFQVGDRVRVVGSGASARVTH